MWPMRVWTSFTPIARRHPIASAITSASPWRGGAPRTSALNCVNSRYRPFCGSSYRNTFPTEHTFTGFGRFRRSER